MESNDGAGQQLIDVPRPKGHTEVTQLAYLESADEVSGKCYAFLLYREDDSKKGGWRLKVKSNLQTASVIDLTSNTLQRSIAKAAASGAEYCLVGATRSPREGDPRQFENRLYFDSVQRPIAVELYAVTRTAEGMAAAPQRVRVALPGGQTNEQ